MFVDDEYPECSKAVAVQDQSQAIGAFLEWLFDKGLQLARVEDAYGPDHGELVPVYKTITEVLAEYFEIDLKKMETEKRAMLAELRKDTA